MGALYPRLSPNDVPTSTLLLVERDDPTALPRICMSRFF
jgi:hypothetical protein